MQIALLPLTGAERAPLLPLTGVLLMGIKTKIGVISVLMGLMLLAGGLLVWRAFFREVGSGPPPNRSSRVASHLPIARPMAVIEAWERSQDGRPGSIAGVVRDADGRATPGAVVALVLATSYDDIEDKTALRPRATTVAADGGVFQFQQVPPGLYLLTATAQRWSPAERTNLSLLPGEAIGALELRLGRGGGPSARPRGRRRRRPHRRRDRARAGPGRGPPSRGRPHLRRRRRRPWTVRASALRAGRGR